MVLIGKLVVALVVIDIGMLLVGMNTNNQLLFSGTLFDVNFTRNATTGAIGNASLNTTYSNGTTWVNNIIPNSDGFFTQLGNLFTLPIFLILTPIRLVFNLLFAPYNTLVFYGAPPELSLLVGATMVLLYIFGFLGILRGGDV